MITYVKHGKFKKTTSYLQRLLEVGKVAWLDKYGRKGVEALKAASPVDTGLMASSWYYKIVHESDGSTRLVWCNSDIENGENIAILVQYGHGTKSGTYVPGKDFINPAIRPVILEIAEEIRREVKR